MQRAANKAALQQSRDADLRWQQAALADDAAKAAKQRAERAERQGRNLDHAHILEAQIEHRDGMRQQLQSARAQVRFVSTQPHGREFVVMRSSS